jgi:hypothetical protein
MKILTDSNFSKGSKGDRLLLLIAVLFFLTSCSTKDTNIISSWTNENYQGKIYKKILVLGISENNSNRAEVESAIVKRLFKKDIPAVASLSLFPPQLQAAPVSEEKMASAIKNNNIDAVLIVSLLDIKEEQRVVPSRTYTEPMYPYYHTPYYGYYSTAHRTVNTPGYTVETEKFYLESNFYSVKSKELVWTAQSESIDPENISDFAAQYSEAIISEMLHAKLFERSK